MYRIIELAVAKDLRSRMLLANNMPVPYYERSLALAYADSDG